MNPFNALEYLLSTKTKLVAERWLHKYRISAGLAPNDDEPFSNVFWEERGAVMVGGTKVPGKHGKDIVLVRKTNQTEPGHNMGSKRLRLDGYEIEHKSNRLKITVKGRKQYHVDFPSIKTHDKSGRYQPGKILFQTLYNVETNETNETNIVLCDVLFVIKENVLVKRDKTIKNAENDKYKHGKGQGYHITQGEVKPICVMYLNEQIASEVRGGKQWEQIKRMWNSVSKQKYKLSLQQIDQVLLKYL